MEAGANVHSAAMDDMSSLHFAAQQGHVEVSRALLNAGKQYLHACMCSHSLILYAYGWILQLLVAVRRSEGEFQDQKGDKCSAVCSQEGPSQSCPIPHQAEGKRVSDGQEW